MTSVTANLSVPTLDEGAWRATEPHTPSPRARLEAVKALNAAGIPTGILIAPLMPGINDAPEQVEAILELAADAGATSVGGITLHLRGEVRGIFLDWLRSQRPDLVARYEELYARGAYAPEGRAGPHRGRPAPRPDALPVLHAVRPGRAGRRRSGDARRVRSRRRWRLGERRHPLRAGRDRPGRAVLSGGACEDVARGSPSR